MTVKPLVWEEIVPGERYIARADDMAVTTDGKGWASHPTNWPPFAGYPFATLDQAKAVAQADYEHRVLSALEPAPAAATEEMREEALRLLRQRDERDDKTQALIEDLREIILAMPYETRPAGLTQKAQDAVYAMRGRMRLLDDAAITAALEAKPTAPTHRHKKRGTEYVLIGIGKMQAREWRERGWNDAYQTETFGTKVDMREVAIYRSATDPAEIWVRPREEFEDGRFEVIEKGGQENG